MISVVEGILLGYIIYNQYPLSDLHLEGVYAVGEEAFLTVVDPAVSQLDPGLKCPKVGGPLRA